MAVFLVGVLASLHFLFSVSVTDPSRGILGGPSSDLDPVFLTDRANLVSEAVIAVSQAAETKEYEDDIFEEEFLVASLEDTSPLVGSVPAPTTILTYKIKKGDTLSRIAVNFGVSQESIRSANPTLSQKVLRVGEEISILPSSGVIYKIQEGDTLESIASASSVAVDRIRELNPGLDLGNLTPEGLLVLPYSSGQSQATIRPGSSLPYLKGYFIQPVSGFNWGRLHNHNAVDIANSCGVPVVAAQEGVVVVDENQWDGSAPWNGGYGHFVLLEHPNGTKTRYAHLGGLDVTVGDYVAQGDTIGTLGNSGNTHGVTGCHTHFEVYGAQNPFAR